jgi:hypothetical protein
MNMNRRAALKYFVIVSAGAAFLPACLNDKKKAVAGLKNLSLSTDQEDLLRAFNQTMIPPSTDLGQKEVPAHLFVIKMMVDCYARADQDKWALGLNDFAKQAKTDYGDDFVRLGGDKRLAMLQSIENKKDKNSALGYFYRTTRSLTIRGYTSSVYYLTKIQPYEIIPGRYHGCVPVELSAKKTS